MTPNDIAMMAMLKELDVIAITDHNSAENVRSVITASRRVKGPVVIPGIEFETAEEIHLVTLFETPAAAESFSEFVDKHRFKVEIDKKIWGRQLIIDKDDNIIGEKEGLLTVSTDLGLYEAVKAAKDYGAYVFPAHIDRTSHGILAILGAIDDDMGFDAVEISLDEGLISEYKSRNYKIYKNSDAHSLAMINEKVTAGSMEYNGEMTAKDIVRFLKSGKIYS